MKEQITGRQGDIIRSIVSAYCHTGYPVGSAVLVETFALDISSATVRKEMSVLEQMGYLESPHTSSGRIPTDEAFRYYIRYLSDHYEADYHSHLELDEFYKSARLQIDQLMQDLSSMLAIKSQSMGIVLPPAPEGSTIKRIELVSVLENSVLIIMVAEGGNIFQKRVTVPRVLSQDDLYKISRFLTKNLQGFEPDEIRQKGLTSMDQTNDLGDLLDTAFFLLQELIYHTPVPKLYMDGSDELYRQVSQTQGEQSGQKLLQWTKKNSFREKLQTISGSRSLNMEVGVQTDTDFFPGLALLSQGYTVGGKPGGSVAVLGMTRLQYDLIIPALDHGARMLSEILSNLENIAEKGEIPLPEKYQ